MPKRKSFLKCLGIRPQYKEFSTCIIMKGSWDSKFRRCSNTLAEILDHSDHFITRTIASELLRILTFVKENGLFMTTTSMLQFL